MPMKNRLGVIASGVVVGLALFGMAILFTSAQRVLTVSDVVNVQGNDSSPAVYYSDWSKDGSTIAIATIDSESNNTLTIYNADFSIRSIWQQTVQDVRRSFYSLSPNGDRILTDYEVWDTTSFQTTILTPDYYLTDWSADGSMILAIPKNEVGFVTLSSTTGDVIQVYSEGIFNMNLEWSPDNRFFVKSDNNRIIYLIDSLTGAVIT
jgi:Tol biopolymer transport system component